MNDPTILAMLTQGEVELDGARYRVMEGDLLVGPQEIPAYLEGVGRRRGDGRGEVTALRELINLDVVDEDPDRFADDRSLAELLGMAEGGRIVRWRPGLPLTYRIAHASFPDDEAYHRVRSAVKDAADAWSAACGVVFRHLPELDRSPNAEGALFDVEYVDVLGAFIAAAFFPESPVDRRRVRIDPSFYVEKPAYDPVGVLRHELGHVLGFRHEHIRSGAPAICPQSKTGLENAIDLSEYDPRSVMHYFCGGVGSHDLEITDVDRRASRSVYGPPVSSFRFYE